MSNFSNRYLRWALGGDKRRDPNRPQGHTRDVWGAVLALISPSRAHGVLIATPPQEVPVPFALEVRFSANGVDFSRNCLSDQVVFEVTKTLDEMGGVIRERVVVARGEPFPFCQLAARSVSLTVEDFTPGEFDGPRAWVSAVLLPTSTYECPTDNPPPTTFSNVRQQGWGFSGDSAELAVHRYTIAEIRTANQVPIPFPAFDAHADRCAFSFSNDSDTKVYVGFGPSSGVIGEGFGSIVLQPGDTYEAPPNCYQGDLTLSVDPDGPDDDNGAVLSTEGRYPAP